VVQTRPNLLANVFLLHFFLQRLVVVGVFLAKCYEQVLTLRRLPLDDSRLSASSASLVWGIGRSAAFFGLSVCPLSPIHTLVSNIVVSALAVLLNLFVSLCSQFVCRTLDAHMHIYIINSKQNLPCGLFSGHHHILRTLKCVAHSGASSGRDSVRQMLVVVVLLGQLLVRNCGSPAPL